MKANPHTGKKRNQHEDKNTMLRLGTTAWSSLNFGSGFCGVLTVDGHAAGKTEIFWIELRTVQYCTELGTDLLHVSCLSRKLGLLYKHNQLARLYSIVKCYGHFLLLYSIVVKARESVTYQMTSNEMDLPRKRNYSLDYLEDAVWHRFYRKGTIGLPFVPFC